MWKLTITQKRKSEYVESMLTEKVEFISGDINELTMLVIRLTAVETAVETSYRIEKVGVDCEQ